MPTFQRYFAFLKRFWPLGAVWLVVLLVPATREVLFLNLVESSVVHKLLPDDFGGPYHPEFNAFRVAKKKPHDLNARVWRFVCLLQNLLEDYSDPADDEIGTDRQLYTGSQLLHEANPLVQEFPEQKGLVALPVCALAPNLISWADALNPLNPNGYLRLRRLRLTLVCQRLISKSTHFSRPNASLS